MAATLPFDTPIALDRDTFMRRLIAGLGHLNEGLLGSDVTGAYIMNVGLSMGAAIEAEYKRFWGIDRPFTVDEYAHVIVDLKQKIHGNFSLVAKSPERVVVRTTSCPFEDVVRQSPSLCFMTSSVFGGIAARNFGYAKVALLKRIALGDPGCHVAVHLIRTPEAEASIGREYFPDVDQASPDITEQLRLMETVRRLRWELSRTSSRWQEVVSAAAEAIVVLERDGRVVYANPRWRDLLGVESDELVGGSFAHLIHPEDQQCALESIAAVVAGTRQPGVSVRLRHRDGACRETLASLGPLRGEDGSIVGILGILRDVSAEREMARLRDALLSSTSHQLRTPVATIKGMTELLLRSLDRDGPLDAARLARHLEVIRREADRLTALGREIEGAIHVRERTRPAALQPVELNAMTAAAVERRRGLLPPGGRHVLDLEGADVPIWVLSEPGRLDQVVDNLIDNAVKFSPEGGRILLQVAALGGQARLRIADSGIGIPATDRASLFTPFYRGSNASARNFAGLGLGLHLSCGIVEAYGGAIVLAVAGDRGATFDVTLPLADGPRAAADEGPVA